MEPIAYNQFVAVCQKARVPLTLDKTIRAVSSILFNGFRLDTQRFPNNYGVTACGVGMDYPRCYKIRRAIREVLSGTTVQKIKSLHGLLVWASTVLPHIRALTGCILSELHGKPDQVIHKPSTAVQANLQRLINIFHKPPMIPLYNLLVLVPPQFNLYTDASGGLHQGVPPHWGGYDNRKNHEWFFSYPIPPKLWTTSLDSSSTISSTALLEMMALYIILHTGHKTYKKPNGITIRWHTDSEACVFAWRNQKSRNIYINRVLMCIAAYCSVRNILVEAVHIPREKNAAADALTHDDTKLFTQLTGIAASHRRLPDSRHLSLHISRISRSDGHPSP